jgi:hypothetical protein
MKEETVQSEASGHLGATDIYDRTSTFRDDPQELMLTKSMGGTLGAYAATPSASSYGSAADSYFNSMVSREHQDKKSNGQQATLGARPLVQDQRMVRHATSNRAGLYDVFAPAGPIGIVVDTTKDGPSVHSLKPTSPMLGLINPGDLIVGLDDEDTRSMTAATLTRLMAKRSNQKERKITLLAAEGY